MLDLVVWFNLQCFEPYVSSDFNISLVKYQTPEKIITCRENNWLKPNLSTKGYIDILVKKKKKGLHWYWWKKVYTKTYKKINGRNNKSLKEAQQNIPIKKNPIDL